MSFSDSFGDNDYPGVLIDGENCPPAMLEAHTPLYYKDFLERYGIEEDHDLYAWRAERSRIGEELKNLPPKLSRVAEVARWVANVTIRKIRMDRWDEEIKVAYHLFTTTLHWLSERSPMAEPEFRRLADQIHPFVDPNLALFALEKLEAVIVPLNPQLRSRRLGAMHTHRSLIAPVVASIKLRELWMRRPELQWLKMSAKALDAEGWYYIGGLAVMDEQGYQRIVGRKKDVIIRGGQNIHPVEVEEYLVSHPKIREAAVVGVPSQMEGETTLAFVILEPGKEMTSQEDLDYCRQELEFYKIPSGVRFVDDFPRSETGKPQKYRLREMEMEKRSQGGERWPSGVPHPSRFARSPCGV